MTKFGETVYDRSGLFQGSRARTGYKERSTELRSAWTFVLQ